MDNILQIEDLVVEIGSFSLKHINLDVGIGEVVALLGENGSGKTTLLNTIAGFLMPKRGSIILNEIDITYFAPYERNIGYIFQNLALFPHLTVEENIRFGLKFKNISDKEKRFKELVGFLKLEKLLKRYTQNLSGGELQKVALARTLILDPLLILFDEPTSQLSPREKEQVSSEIRDIIARFKKSAVYVTHSVEEAHIVADRIAIIEDGSILQVGTPSQIFYRPINESVARIGEVNVLEGIIESKEGELSIVKIGSLYIQTLGDFQVGDRVKIFIRPEEIFISAEMQKTSARNNFEGRVEKILNRGILSKVSVSIESGFTLDVLVTRKSFEEMALKAGDRVFVSFKVTSIHCLKV